MEQTVELFKQLPGQGRFQRLEQLGIQGVRGKKGFAQLTIITNKKGVLLTAFSRLFTPFQATFRYQFFLRVWLRSMPPIKSENSW